MSIKVTRNTIECEQQRIKHSQLKDGIIYRCSTSSGALYFKTAGRVFVLNKAGLLSESGNNDSLGQIYTETDESICIHIGKNV